MNNESVEAVTSGRPQYLALSTEEMKRLGYAAVDMLVEHFNTVEQKPVIGDQNWRPTSGLLAQPFSEEGKSADDVLARVREEVFEHCIHINHPRFFGYVPGSSNFISVIADQLASGFNIFSGTNQGNLGPITVERNTIQWLCEQFGMPDSAGGLFASGGSAASLMALTAARHELLADQTEKAVIYCTKETHTCIDRSLFMLGFSAEQIVKLESDENLRLPPEVLLAAIATDRKAGKIPFCVVGSGGTTSSGSVDPLDAIADICEREGLWFHVDAAFGGGAILTERGRKIMKGIERAHSIAIDPHKWLFQPYECACVLMRDPNCLRRAFSDVADYERDGDADKGEMNYREMGLQRTRSFKALKLWMSLQIFGVDAFRQAVDHGLDLAQAAERHLRARDNWEIVTPATFGIVTFRYLSQGLSGEELDELNRAMTAAITESGYALMSTTVLFGKKVQRLCLNRLDATEADVIETIERLESIAIQLLGKRQDHKYAKN
ncbi:MAG: aromatic-L-amino-acid decarboxylase [Gammaproteobacteria bacterium]|jgi:aromatic-L-amino-acid decarboxylase